MNADVTPKSLEAIVNEKIYPFILKSDSPVVRRLAKGKWTEDELREACEVGTYYLRYAEGKLLQSSVETFVSKLGGILHNRRLATQDPEFSVFVSDLTSKLGKSQSWKKGKALTNLKFIYKSGQPVQDLYKLCASAKTWTDVLMLVP